MKIEVLTSKRVEKVDANMFILMMAPKLKPNSKFGLQALKHQKSLPNLEGFEKDRMGRLSVYATLQTKAHPDIFAFGDCAHCQPRADEPVLGPRAQVASQQASFLVDCIKGAYQVVNNSYVVFSDKGSLVSLSKHKAVGELLGQVNVQGFVAKSMYVSLYRIHQATIYGYAHAGLLTAKDFVTRKIAPKIKLH